MNVANLPVRRAIRSAGMFLGLALFSAVGGCVERSITVVTDPPGSLVYLNDVEKGRSPCTIDFKWYGTYSVRLRGRKNIGTPRKPKYDYYYLHTHRTTVRPWFEWYGVDLVASLLPIQFKDHEIWAFDVPPIPQESGDQLIQNARRLKAQLPKSGGE